MFEGNRATNNDITAQVQFRKSGGDGNNASHGGGIHITFKGTNTRNSIEIVNCTFHSNSVQYGSGIIFQDHSHENTLSVSNCVFKYNSAPEMGGGADVLADLLQ